MQRLLGSAELKAEADRQRQVNGQIVTGVQTPTTVPLEPKRSALQLPNLSELGQRMSTAAYRGAQEIRYGRHNVVSTEGEVVIEQIRQTFSGTPEQRRTAWEQIKAEARQGLPEATHFLGYVVEFGLLGQQADVQLASRYYQTAAARGYQPAIYNLALQAGYGRTGPQNLQAAVRLMERATALGADTSFRVCGMGSYLAYRAKQQAAAIKFSERCPSTLAALALARQKPTPLDGGLVEQIRQSIGAGADDGYSALEELGRLNVDTDRQLLYCKYRLLGVYHRRDDVSELKSDALRCAQQVHPLMPRDLALSLPAEQLASSLIAFVVSERAAIKVMREGSRYHYGRSVPYLPFGAAETELVESALQAVGAAQVATTHQPTAR